MNNVEVSSQVQQIIQELDRLIAEMSALRQQVVSLGATSSTPQSSSIRQAEYFGMWADHEEMQGRSSREWLEDLRQKQWRQR